MPFLSPIKGTEPSKLSPGDTVQVFYWGYSIIAEVIEVEPMGRYGKQHGWITVEQISDYEDADERPRFEAHSDYMLKASA